MRCIICGKEKEPSKEHIIPEALGNKSFITYKVCERCNNQLGAYVDNHLTDHVLIKMKRKNMKLFGKGKKDVKIFPSCLTDINGDKYMFRNDVPFRIPKVEKKNDVLHIEAGTFDEAIKLGKNKLKKAGYSPERIAEILQNQSKSTQRKYQPTFELPINLDIGRYLLSGIKIAYEFASQVLDEKYFDDAIAQIFRQELYKMVENKEVPVKVNYSSIKNYATLLQKDAIEFKDKVEKLLEESPLRPLHMCLLHESMEHELICEVILLFENIMSFSIMISKDAIQYGMERKYKGVLLLEDGNILSI